MPMSEQNHISPDNVSGACPIVISSPAKGAEAFELATVMFEIKSDKAKI